MSSGPYKLIYEVLLIDDGSEEENLDPLYDFADRWEGLAEYGISFFLNSSFFKPLRRWRPTKGVVKVKRLPEHIGSIAAKTQAAKEASGEILGLYSTAIFSIVFWDDD